MNLRPGAPSIVETPTRANRVRGGTGHSLQVANAASTEQTIYRPVFSNAFCEKERQESTLRQNSAMWLALAADGATWTDAHFGWFLPNAAEPPATGGLRDNLL